MTQESNEQQQVRTIQIGDQVYDINEFNQRGLRLLEHIQVVSNEINQLAKSMERNEVLQNTLYQTLRNHITEVGYTPIEQPQASNEESDGASEEQEEQ